MDVQELLKLTATALDRLADGESFNRVIESTGLTHHISVALRALAPECIDLDHAATGWLDDGIERPPQDAIRVAAEVAQIAFWDSIARYFAGTVVSGDLPPEDTFRFDAACARAVHRWLEINRVAS